MFFYMNNDTKSTDVSEEISGNQIVQYFAYFEESSLKGIAKKCSRLMINENFGAICSGEYAEPSFEEMEELVLEELSGNFDEKVAAAIAGAGCNITNVSVDTDRSMYATNLFTVQVANRMHLAKMMRALRHVQEVVRISRVKGAAKDD